MALNEGEIATDDCWNVAVRGVSDFYEVALFTGTYERHVSLQPTSMRQGLETAWSQLRRGFNVSVERPPEQRVQMLGWFTRVVPLLLLRPVLGFTDALASALKVGMVEVGLNGLDWRRGRGMSSIQGAIYCGVRD